MVIVRSYRLKLNRSALSNCYLLMMWQAQKTLIIVIPKTAYEEFQMLHQQIIWDDTLGPGNSYPIY